MSITNKQKGMIHIYLQAAQIEDKIYRGLLKQIANVKSCADKKFNNTHFDELMRCLESRLAIRVVNGIVPNPVTTTKKISSMMYWRNKCKDRLSINTRQKKKISDLWKELKAYLPVEKRTKKYLRSIASQAAGEFIEKADDMKQYQANLLIEALKDRLYYAKMNANTNQPELQLCN